ncbi:hypothetical protein J6590_053724 [Homalodisca vitripennis]|nr:hypothetical protein J6590_053724 [Homalodisca vitripennis]
MLVSLVLVCLSLLAICETEGSGLINSVPCYDAVINKIKASDPVYDRNKWDSLPDNIKKHRGNVLHEDRRINAPIKVIDQFVQGDAIKYQHVSIVCELKMDGLKWGNYWLNDAFDTRWPGEVGYIILPSDNHFLFFIRTTRRSHSVRYRIQFFAQATKPKYSASFTCVQVNTLFDSGTGLAVDNGCEFRNWPSK